MTPLLPLPLPLPLPLLAPREPSAPLAWRHGVAISAAQFIGEAQALAATLPAHGRPVNLCQDRYHFALALAAALLRGQTSLMPPNALPDTLRQLHDDGADAAYALTDDDTLALHGLPSVAVRRPSGVAPAAEMPTVPAELLAIQLLTSGSTGAPQPHAKRFGDLVINIGAEAERLAQYLGLPDLRSLNIAATVPAQHSYGIESTVLLAMLGGACFDAGRPFYPADVASVLARLPEPRALVTTPFHLKTLLRAGLALPRTALTLSATAPLSPQLAAQAEAALAGQLIEIYGCTEAGQVASRRTTENELWTTLGALRITAEAPQGSNEVERFSVCGGHVREPTPLADVLVLEDAQHFRLMGRANDLIHVAGKRSSLAHLNYHLNRIEGVEDGAFWVPQEDGEAVARTVAFVVAPTLSAEQIKTALRSRLEAVFVPRRVVQVAALPRESTGKLTAAALGAFAQAQLAEAANRDDDRVSARWPIAVDHPGFDGHFPGRPLLPGVVLLSMVMETLAKAPRLAARLGAAPRFEQIKFLAPVAPGAELTVRLKVEGRGVAFEVIDDSVGSRVAVRGQLAASTPAG